jgi:type I restriction enzyme R subunit
VDAYLDADSWRQITADKRDELTERLVGLPARTRTTRTARRPGGSTCWRSAPARPAGRRSRAALRQQVQRIAEDLLDPRTLNNPVVGRNADFLTEVAGDAWWEDVTLPMLERMRQVMRGLVRLIPTERRGVVYTDFEDERGTAARSDRGSAPRRKRRHQRTTAARRNYLATFNNSGFSSYSGG